MYRFVYEVDTYIPVCYRSVKLNAAVVTGRTLVVDE